MLDEYQIFLYDLQNAYLNQKPSRSRIIDILSDHKNYTKILPVLNNLQDRIELQISENIEILVENFSKKYDLEK